MSVARHRIGATIAAIGLSLLGACGAVSDGDSLPPHSAAILPTPPSLDQISTAEVLAATAITPSRGGKVSAHGASLVVPAHAVDHATKAEIRDAGDSIVDLSVSGGFKRRVTVTMSLEGPSDVIIHYVNDGWRIESSRPGDGTVVVDHLSPFSTLQKLSKHAPCFKTGVAKKIVNCLIARGITTVSMKFISWLADETGVTSDCTERLLGSGGKLSVVHHALSGACVGSAGETDFTCRFTDAGNGNTIMAGKGTEFTDSRGRKYRVAIDCGLSEVESSRCSYKDAGNGESITADRGSTFTDSRRIKYRVGNDCGLSEVESSRCSYKDAGNGESITADKGSTFTDSRRIKYGVGNDCGLSEVESSRCSYKDAGNGESITADKGSTFTDSRRIKYRVGNDCGLSEVESSRCSYKDAGNGESITADKGSTFTDSRRIKYRVGNDCGLTQMESIACSYNDAGNGQLIKAEKGGVFTDSRGMKYRVDNDCKLTQVA